MSDGRKLILSNFTGHKKRKAWNMTREKYMPVKRRQMETDRGSYYSKEDGSDNDDEKYNENNEQQQLL